MRHFAAGLVVLAVILAGDVGAQARTLHWRAITVDARLDSAGNLHVRERQAMVFNGDWNGGQRSFSVPMNQRFTFERLLMLDSLTGATLELREGDLDETNNYGWAENRTLRWRSRQPNDPLFRNTELTYVLEFSYSNILVPQRDGSFLLDHDFAFADREGYIGQFIVNLEIDSAWSVPAGVSGTFGPISLPPGEGYVVTVPLTYRAAGQPSGVYFGAGAATRFPLAVLLLAGLGFIALTLFRYESASGRLDGTDLHAPVDERWLEANVFNMRPEVVGAAWDDATGAPEVTALLARLEGEKKLKSEVTKSGLGWFSTPVLTLRLLVPRNQFRSYERDLIDALFQGSEQETDTKRIRKRYAKTGFDPSSKIKFGVEALLKAHDRSQAPEKPKPMRTLFLLGAFLVLAIVGAILHPADLVVLIFAAIASMFTFIVAMIQAVLWQKRLENPVPHMLRFIIPVGLLAAALIFILARAPFRVGPFALAALVALVLAVASSVFNLARGRHSAERIVLRKRLMLARNYFREQLKHPHPVLRDEWFPYLLAFGLGNRMDKWFRAFGGATTPSRDGYTSSTSSFGSSSSSAPTWSGMGGGGGFAGGGSSSSWAAAAGLMASGVSAPSSSSSGGGGGGGGGGSSGGGGGGGW